MMVNGVPPSAIDSTIRDLDAHDHGAHGARFYQKKRTSALPLNSAIIAILYSSADKVSNSNFDGKLISHVEVNTLEMLLRMQDGSTCLQFRMVLHAHDSNRFVEDREFRFEYCDS